MVGCNEITWLLAAGSSSGGAGHVLYVPSGKSPLSPLSVFLPRNQPSPKSSSRSISSTRSPRARLSSSGLRAWNSSVGMCQRSVFPRHAANCCPWGQGAAGRRRRRELLTHNHEHVARPRELGVGACCHCGSWQRGQERYTWRKARCSADSVRLSPTQGGHDHDAVARELQA
jgi:hypothetical protein